MRSHRGSVRDGMPRSPPQTVGYPLIRFDMRDYVLTAFVFGMVPFCVARPWIGILMWYWLGLMSPHRLTWSFAYTMPFAMVI